MSVTHTGSGFVVDLDRVAEGVLAMLSKIGELGYEQLRDLPTAGERRSGHADCGCTSTRDFAELSRVMHQNLMLQLIVAQQPHECGLAFLPRRRAAPAEVAVAAAPAVPAAAAEPAAVAAPALPGLPSLRDVVPSLDGVLPSLDEVSPLREIDRLAAGVEKMAAAAFRQSPQDFLGHSLTEFGLAEPKLSAAKEWLQAETGILPLIRDRHGRPVLKDASEYVREAMATAGPDDAWPPLPDG